MLIHHTEMKSFSTTHTRTEYISSYTGAKSSSIPHTESMSIWTTHTKCKSICILPKSKIFSPRVQKPNRFRPPTQLWNQFNLYTEASQCRSPLQNQVIFGCRDTKTTLISIQTLKPSHFLPPHNTQVHSDPRTKNKSISIPILKPISFRCKD